MRAQRDAQALGALLAEAKGALLEGDASGAR